MMYAVYITYSTNKKCEFLLIIVTKVCSFKCFFRDELKLHELNVPEYSSKFILIIITQETLFFMFWSYDLSNS